jgi:hypothetical protein
MEAQRCGTACTPSGPALILKDNLIRNYYSPLFMKIYYSNVCYKIEKVILQEKFEKIKLLQIFLPIVSEITLQIHSFLIIFLSRMLRMVY